MKLLALDTAGAASSVAVWRDGEVLTRTGPAGGHHSEHLLALVEEILGACGLPLQGLDAIACGRGPGAFTGVRLAVGLAQGLAFAADLPVIPVSNLAAAAGRAFDVAGAPARMLVCQDARMHEVYWAACERAGQDIRLVGAEAVGRPEAVSPPEQWDDAGIVWGVGTGFEAYPVLAERLHRRLQRWLALEARAEDIARLGAHVGLAQAVSPELAAPQYLRDDVVQAPERSRIR
jgi:tRNA threonylcarbamoyladenosine biosynthesis protein TsaB